MSDMIDPLSEHFTWSEATHSETAIRLGIDNTPPLSVRVNIRTTAAKMDRLRKFVGKPVHVTSWYRCVELNRALRSRDNSAHVQGWAVDFVAPSYGSTEQLFDLLAPLALDMRADQIIREFAGSARGGWVHISFDPRGRGQKLVIDGSGTRFA